MDSLTQAVLGAGLQGAILGRQQGRKALLYGALLGTLPDLDVLIPYPDPIATLTYHRGFSHAIVVLTALALLLTWLVRRLRPNPDYGAGRLFLAVWLVLVTHALLDAFTVYGTQLFWPLPWAPENWGAVYIIDPVYTLPMLAAVVAAAIVGCTAATRRAMAATLLFGLAYLLWGAVERGRAEDAVRQALAADGIAVQRTFAAPMPFTNRLWRVLAETPDGRYVEAVHGGLLTRTTEYHAGEPLHRDLGEPLRGTPALERLRWFTDDWIRYDQMGKVLVASDLRMGVAGHPVFRYVIAEQDDAGRWQAVTPRRWRSERGGWPEIRLVWGRLLDPLATLPLAAWSRQLTQVPDEEQ